MDGRVARAAAEADKIQFLVLFNHNQFLVFWL